MITVSDINKMLGTNLKNVSELCTSDKINKWSFYKPIQLSKSTSLSDLDYYSVNDGFTNIMYNSPFELMHNLDHGWKYEVPDSNFRLGDFSGYISNRSQWFKLEINGKTTTTNGGNINLTISDDLQNLVNNFHIFNGNNTANIDLGLIISTKPFSEASSCYYYKVCTLIDYDEKISLKIDETLQPATYNVIAVLTDYTNIESGHYYYFRADTTVTAKWYMLPYSQVQFNVEQGSITDDVFKKVHTRVTEGTYNEGSDYNGEYVSDIDFNLTVSVSGDYVGSDIVYSGDIYFNNAYINNTTQDIKIGQVNGKLNSGESKSFNITYSNKIYYLAGDMSEKMPLTLNLYINGKKETRSIYINKIN